MNPEKLKILSQYYPEVAAKLEQKQANETVAKLAEVLTKIPMTRGEKGDAGYSPVKGKDYWTPEEVKSMIKYILESATPVKGKHYFDGENGRNPLTVSKTEPLNPQTGDLWYKN